MTKITWQAELRVPSDDRDGTTGVKFEDSGQAAIMYYSDEAIKTGDDGCFFVRLHSWDERKITDPAAIEHQHYKSTEPQMARIVQKPPKYGQHPLFRSLMGRKVRVTVETIDDDETESEKP